MTLTTLKHKKPKAVLQPSMKLSSNRKTQHGKNDKNTFGLLHGTKGTCPGATTGEGGCQAYRILKSGERSKEVTCYVDDVTRVYKNVGAVLEANTTLLKQANLSNKIAYLIEMVNTWYKKTGKTHPYFRLHWAGDFFSTEYAEAWKVVINHFPGIKFWVYTRSLFAVDILKDCDNLALYISCDPVNQKEVLELYETSKLAERKNVALAYMGNTLLINTMKFIKCPEITGKVKNTAEAGACSKCRLCYTFNEKVKLRNIQFQIH